MPAIPTALDLTPSEGAGPAVGAIQPTDFGLGAAAEALHSATIVGYRAEMLGERAQAALNMQAITPVLQPAMAAVQANYDKAVANKETLNPDFAAKQVAFARDALTSAVRSSNLTPAQVQQASQVIYNHTNTIANQAGLDVARELGDVVTKNRQANDAIQMANAQQVAAALTDPKVLNANANALTDPHIGQTIGGIYDEGTAAGRQALMQAMPDRPDLWGEYDVKQATARSVAMSEAVAAQAQGTQKQVAVALQRNIDMAAASLREAPSEDAYAKQTAMIDNLIALAPGDWQDGLKAEAHQSLATNLLNGMKEHGLAVEAQGLLNSGKYNAALGDKAGPMAADLDAAAKTNAPSNIDQQVAHDKAMANANAANIIYATTGVDTGDQLKALAGANASLEEQGAYERGRTAAANVVAASGPIPGMSIPELQAVVTSPPPSGFLADGKTPDPDLATNLAIYNGRVAAARQQLADLSKDPAATVLTPTKPNDQATVLQNAYTQLHAGGANAAQAGRSFALGTLFAEDQHGVPRASMTLIPQSTAQSLVAGVMTAAPEDRAGQLQHLATMMQNMPASVRLSDGSIVNTGPMFVRSLATAGLAPTYVAALSKFGDQQGSLTVAMAALTDSRLAKPDKTTAGKAFDAGVATAMKPVLALDAHFIGAGAGAQGEIDLATMIARHFKEQGMNDNAATAAAVKLFQGDTRYMGSWSIPNSAAAQPGVGGVRFWSDGADAARVGASYILRAAVANNGANLAGGAPRANQVSTTGQWRNMADNSGLQLYTPQKDGSYAPVMDKFGRPITAGWSELQSIGRSEVVPPSKFAPPPNHTTTPAGAPVPAFSKQAGFNALVNGVTAVESHGQTGLVAVDERTGKPSTDPDAPRGVMQIKPSTAAPYAQSLFGAPVDNQRLQNDAAYNTKIGRALLQDGINRYGNTSGGLALTIANQIAGPGNLQKIIRDYGDPRTPGVNVNQWIAKLKTGWPHTGAYVENVAAHAYQELTRGG